MPCRDRIVTVRFSQVNSSESIPPVTTSRKIASWAWWWPRRVSLKLSSQDWGQAKTAATSGAVSVRIRICSSISARNTDSTTLTGLPAQAASNYPGTVDPYDGYIQDVDVVESMLRPTARQMTVDVDLCFESGATISPSTTGIDGAPLLQLGPEVVPVASGWRTIRPGVQRADTTVNASTGERYTVRCEVFRSTGDGVQAQSTVKVLPQASPHRGGCGVLRMPVSMPTSQINGNVLDTWATDQFGTTHEDSVQISANAPAPSVPTTATLTLNRPWVALRGNTLCPTRLGDNLHPASTR